LKITYTEQAIADIIQAITYINERNMRQSPMSHQRARRLNAATAVNPQRSDTAIFDACRAVTEC
jgi:hypothetical protein